MTVSKMRVATSGKVSVPSRMVPQLMSMSSFMRRKRPLVLASLMLGTAWLRRLSRGRGEAD